MEKKRSNFSSFPQYFQYISNFRSQITYSFVKCAVRFIVFLISANLICRGTDISKCFRESLGIRDNESRLYTFFQSIIVFDLLILRNGEIDIAPGFAKYLYLSTNTWFM